MSRVCAQLRGRRDSADDQIHHHVENVVARGRRLVLGYRGGVREAITADPRLRIEGFNFRPTRTGILARSGAAVPPEGSVELMSVGDR